MGRGVAVEQLTAEDVRAIPASLMALLTRTGERLASLETRATVEIAALKKDTESIRINQHDQRNEMQKIVAAEQQCATSLAAINVQMTSLAAHLEKLTTTVEENVSLRQQASGAWWALGKVAIVLGFIFSGIAAATTITLKLLQGIVVN